MGSENSASEFHYTFFKNSKFDPNFNNFLVRKKYAFSEIAFPKLMILSFKIMREWWLLKDLKRIVVDKQSFNKISS